MTEILIFGEIGWDVTAGAVADQAAAADPAAPILARIHSPGGSVLDGQAMLSALSRHPAGFEAVVEGMAFSMAALLAISGARLAMPADAWLMFHRAQWFAGGNSDELREKADVLDAMDRAQGARITAKLGEDGAKDLLAKIETGGDVYYNGLEAEDLGLVDELLPAAALAACKSRRDHKPGEDAPEALLTYLDNRAPIDKPDPNRSNRNPSSNVKTSRLFVFLGNRNR
jgi:ATP-dependent protease ClpP protease subunit